MRPDFECGVWDNPLNNEGCLIFRVGECHRQWKAIPGVYEILSFINEMPGNGDFGHAMDWFEESCRRDGYRLRIREVGNKQLRTHLIEKRGFVKEIGYDYIKTFTS